MKILYISLVGDEEPEDISLFPSSYGGSNAVPRGLKYYSDIDFWYAGSPIIYNKLEKSADRAKFIPLINQDRASLLNGVELNKIIKFANNFDLIFHSQTRLFLNTNIKQCVWGVGFYEEFHINHKHVLLFSLKHQHPQFNSRPFVYEFVLGVEVPKFKNYKKENYGLVIGNQRSQLQSAALANLCNQLSIPCVFAGKIDKDYKEEFLKSIDNKNTTYLGEVSHQKKIELNQKARCVFQLHTNYSCFTLAGKESLSYGTPVICTPNGEFPEIITNGVNGFLVNNTNEIIQAYHASKDVLQIECYKTAEKYSMDKMINSLRLAFEKVLNCLD